MADVYIRPLRVEDASVSYRWRNIAEIWRYTGSKPDREITCEMETEWAKRVVADPSRRNFAICECGTDRYVGNVYLINIDGTRGELGLFIGDLSARGFGYGAQALECLKKVAFEELGLREIMIDVDPENHPAMRTYEKCGAHSVGPCNQDGRMWMKLIQGG